MRLPLPIPFRPDWRIAPAKFLFVRVQRPPREVDEIVTAFRDGTVTLRRNRRVEGFTNAVQEFGYQGIRTGDLVIHSMDGFAGAIGVSQSDGKSSPVVHAYVPEPGVEPRFYAYLLRTLARSGYIFSLARGIRERSTAFDSETFRSMLLPCPPLREQTAIADYLDAETVRIDALIEKKQRMLALLEERLVRAVSELSNIGPLVRVRYLTSLITSGPRGWADHVSDEGLPFVRSANLQRNSIEISKANLAKVTPPPTSEATRSSIRTGDVLVGITGANTGWVGLVPDDLAGGFVSQHVAILRPQGVEPEWLANSLVADQAQDHLLGGQYGGTKQQLGLEDLAELHIGLPEGPAQRSAVRQLSSYRSRHERLCSTLGQEVALLHDHRQAVITAAVTGELAVPGVAA